MKKLSGQTLMEIVFAMGVLALIGIGIVSLSTTGVRNSDFSENKTEINKYTQQTLEWLSFEKSDQWSTFRAHAGNNDERVYCIECLTGIDPGCTASWAVTNEHLCNTVEPTEDYIVGTKMFREIGLERIDDTTSDNCTKETCVKARVRVFWVDSSGTHDVESSSIFTDWESL